MADPESLVKGNCYFQLSYVDTELLIPVIDTYIYIKTSEDDECYWLFQDADSFASQSDVVGDYLAVPEEQLYSMVDIAELRTNLKSLLHLHPIVGNIPSKKVFLTDKNRAILLSRVRSVLRQADPSNSLTITTNYRDKGVSIHYEKGNIVTNLFLDCKEMPEEEQEVREIFSERKIEPIKDYLSQHERTRILSYAIAGEAERIAIILGDIFIRAYQIRENEKLALSYR